MKRNRLIDGWRGLSVSLVIVGHLTEYRFSKLLPTTPFHILLGQNPPHYAELMQNIGSRLITPLPEIGVQIFFIISGYLITSLLMKEELQHGLISVKAFYVRRIFRIIPVFYLYIFTMFILSASAFVTIPNKAFVWGGLFLCDLPSVQCTWFLGHTWSLSVEEQFYFIWPMIFVIAGNKFRSICIWSALIGMTLISLYYTLSISFASIAIGSAIVISKFARAILLNIQSNLSILIAALIIFIKPFFASFYYLYAIISAASPVLLALIFFGTLNGLGPFVRIVSFEWLRRVGIISYSIYIWQQVSTGHPDLYELSPILMVPIWFIIPAILSHYFIEKPMIQIGRTISERLIENSISRHQGRMAKIASKTKRYPSDL